MTRPAKPVQLQLIQGNPNKLTKAHIEDRKKAEIKIGDNIFIASDRLRSDKKAIARWNEIITIFAETGIEFITSSDSGFIERYCLLYSYHNELLETKKEIDSKKWGKVKTYHAINELGLNKEIIKFSELLLKMEDRLFLNPLAKIRNVPRRKKEQKKDEIDKMLDAI